MTKSHENQENLIQKFYIGHNFPYNPRSVTNIPEHLNLEEVDTNEKLAAHQLRHLVRFCPNLKRIRFKYLPANDFTSLYLRRQQSLQEPEPMRTDDSLESDESPTRSIKR
jgi:hypothetical protein